jgi:hypothetical protein
MQITRKKRYIGQAMGDGVGRVAQAVRAPTSPAWGPELKPQCGKKKKKIYKT